MVKTKQTGRVKVHFKKPFPHDVVFNRSKKGTAKAARKRFTRAKAEALLKGLKSMPTKRAGKKGGMSAQSKAKAVRTIKRKFKSL